MIKIIYYKIQHNNDNTYVHYNRFKYIIHQFLFIDMYYIIYVFMS